MDPTTTGYDALTYLLDRANIEDTVNKLYTYYDTHNATGLADEVFAPEIRIDYTAIFGGDVARHDGKKWADSVIGICKAMSSHQHATSAVVTALPQPGPNAARPSTSTVTAKVNATNVRYEARGGPLMQNGGRCDFEVVRIPELEAKGVNPWRITLQRVFVAWEKGNSDVLTPLAPLMAQAAEMRLS